MQPTPIQPQMTPIPKPVAAPVTAAPAPGAAATATITPNNVNVQDFIAKARQAGKKDDEIYDYLKAKKLIPEDKIVPEAPKAEKSIGGFIGNVAKSGLALVGDIGNAIIHPIKTIESVGTLAKGVVDNITGNESDANHAADKVGEYFKNRYGSLDKAIESAYSDPVGVLADLSTFIGGAGLALKGTAMAGKIGEVTRVAGLASKVGAASELADTTRLGSTAAKLAEVSKATDPLRMIASGTGKAATAAGKAVAATEGVGAALDKIAEIKKGAGKVIDNLKTGNLDEQTKTILTAAKDGETPQQTVSRVTNKYNEYKAAEDAYKTNPKADTALEMVGSKIGDKFQEVIQKRRDIGKQLGEATKATGGLKVPTADAVGAFKAELADSGLRVKPNGNFALVDRKTGTAFNASERSMLKNFYAGVSKLKNASPEAISNFLRKTTTDLNITAKEIGSTNAERIIKGTMNKLSESFNVSDNPALKNLYNLRQEYTRLSNMLDEGATYLGKKSPISGEYMRDAGLAKASIKSLHAGNKKDFLVALGNEATGAAKSTSDFIEEATIAAQAMKDAGNFKQASLLEELATGAMEKAAAGNIPTGTGLIRQGLGQVVGKGIEKLLGSPDARTRDFIGKTAGSTEAVRAPGVIKRGANAVGRAAGNAYEAGRYGAEANRLQR